jgi:hypothetical protein
MIDEMSSEVRAEIEQGKRYRQRPALKINASRNVWLALILASLFVIGIRYVVIAGMHKGEFNYWNPIGGVLDNVISAGTICIWAGIFLLFARDWKGRVRAGIMLGFLLLPVGALINGPTFGPGVLGTGGARHLTSVPYDGHMYHLEVSYFSGVYPFLFECDRTGTWCHEADCFPYDDTVTNEYGPNNEFARKVAENSPICSTGRWLPTPDP